MADDLDKRHAVYVGSFDPVTLGHVDIIHRGAEIFDRLTVGIGRNPDKEALFEPNERAAMLTDVCGDLPEVSIETFEGLSVEFVRKIGAGVLLRGVRSLMDIELELTMSLTNRTLEPRIETVFLMANERYSHVSSTLIKQIARFGGRAVADRLEQFVPQPLIPALIDRYHGGK
ncbi:pantetheine-phosphate adenylyltransferase [Stratiformator vulcanicus]|uniref:Phosphopantetheine adenylyltransferase n=1 Tax=Stratiformator vulcanicus TaxID=2527980 RepID=A0A517R307_9PLAN|nr:pantetheine-phosphate adenylyltransferase [Stratiformator vulcanicus]QDT38268.1 Phosphopantetheine adenylyltransferase [Stratiformator vulcanicus]